MKKLILSFLFLCLSLVVYQSFKTPERLRKTSVANDLYNFQNYQSLDQYTLKYQEYIRHFRPNLATDEIDNLTPLTIKKVDSSCHKISGILLVHGLSDSPFSLSDITKNIVQNKNCVIIKSLLIPGHSLVPGSSLEVKNQDWINAVNFALEDFKNEKTDNITAIGFSTGSALILNQILSDNKKTISKAVFFSPAFDIGLSRLQSIQLRIIDFISNPRPLNFLAYLEKHSDENIYQYESFSYHGINNLHNVIRINNQLITSNKVNIPTLFFFSDVDGTVKSATTIEMINNDFTNASGIIFSNNGVEIKNITTIKPVNLAEKILDLSHTSIQTSGDNYYFGKNAKINRGCLHYDTKKTQDIFNACRNSDGEFYFGETSNDNLQNYKNNLSRITYNPYYQEVVKKLNDFIN